MVIPEGVNFPSFYSKAREKGIVITSRYKGVYAQVNTMNSKNKIRYYLNWKSTFKLNGINHYLGTFPFTEQGELDAHMAYVAYIKENNLEKNLKQPGKKICLV